MTVAVSNTANTDLVSAWRVRTNQLAAAMSNVAVTVNSNTAQGNAAVSGSLQSNAVHAAFILGGTAGAAGNLQITTNVSFSGQKTNLGVVANVVISGGNSTHRILQVNSAAGNSLYAGRIDMHDVVQFSTAAPVGDNDVLVFDTFSNTFVTTSANQFALYHTHNFAALTDVPTTLDGYGVTVASVGNSTVNATMSSTLVNVANSTNRANLTSGKLVVDNISVNKSVTISNGSITFNNVSDNLTITAPAPAQATGNSYLSGNGSFVTPVTKGALANSVCDLDWVEFPQMKYRTLTGWVLMTTSASANAVASRVLSGLPTFSSTGNMKVSCSVRSSNPLRYNVSAVPANTTAVTFYIVKESAGAANVYMDFHLSGVLP